MSEPLQVSLYDGDAEEWDSFVHRHENSTFFHKIGWKNVVEKTYGHQPFYLVARENGQIKGILPLFLMRHILFGRFLISVPFGDYGGICADDEKTATALLLEAIELAQKKRAKYLELRHFDKMDNGQVLTKTSRATLILQLKNDPQLLWDGLRSQMRNHVRKAHKSGLEVEIGRETLLPGFYEVLAHNMRDLGTPVHSLSFFQNILREFPQHTNLFLVKLNEKAIGGGIATYFKDTMEIPWSSSLRTFFTLRPNNLLYWTALEYGCKKGYKYFNFGRSPWDSGTFQFKKQWGAEPVLLHYQYYLNKGDKMPDYTPSTGSRFAFAVWFWKRLPVGLTKMLGPKIIAGIPY